MSPTRRKRKTNSTGEAKQLRRAVSCAASHGGIRSSTAEHSGLSHGQPTRFLLGGDLVVVILALFVGLFVGLFVRLR